MLSRRLLFRSLSLAHPHQWLYFLHLPAPPAPSLPLHFVDDMEEIKVGMDGEVGKGEDETAKEHKSVCVEGRRWKGGRGWGGGAGQDGEDSE